MEWQSLSSKLIYGRLPALCLSVMSPVDTWSESLSWSEIRAQLLVWVQVCVPVGEVRVLSSFKLGWSYNVFTWMKCFEFCLYLWFFRDKSHYVFQDGLHLMVILLPQPASVLGLQVCTIIPAWLRWNALKMNFLPVCLLTALLLNVSTSFPTFPGWQFSCP